ncbi:MAG: ATP-binding protein [Candidatus Nitrosopolaris sp.]
MCLCCKEQKEVEEQDHQEEAIVTVEDTGSGINPEIFPRLFTKFSSKSFSGTGLGLYISKNIVEAHGGKIWAQNNNDKEKSLWIWFSTAHYSTSLLYLFLILSMS